MKFFARGFTLTELMVTVVIAGVITSMAMVHFGGQLDLWDLDLLGEQLSAAVTRARARAMKTGSTYLVDVRPNSVAWCQIDPANPSQSTCPTPTSAICPASPAAPLCESSQTLPAPRGSGTLNWATRPDLDGTATLLPLAPGAPIYLFRDGTASTAGSTAVARTGATLYLQGITRTWQRRKIVILPASGRPRVIDRW